MDKISFISSHDNPKIQHIRSLRDSRKAREVAKEFILELPKSIDDLLTRNPGLISGIYVAKSKWAAYSHWAAKADLFCVDDAVFSKVSTVKNSQGALAVVRQKQWALELEKCAKIVVVDGVSIPANLGAIIRNGAAFGLDALLITEGSVDPYHPESVRAASGLLDLFPILALTDTHLHPLKNRPWLFFSPNSDAVLKPADLIPPFVIVLGGEGQGIADALSKSVGSHAKCIQIPTSPLVESLNVAVTSGIVLYLSKNAH